MLVLRLINVHRCKSASVTHSGVAVACGLVVALSLQAGCTTTKYRDLPVDQQEWAAATQPGYHLLSEYFSVEVSNGRNGRMTFYFLGQSKRERRPLGTIASVWADYAEFGTRQIAYAISGDGKRLLFFDEFGIDQGKTRFGPNLYLFDAQEEKMSLIYRDVHRQTFSIVKLPRNFIYYGRVRPGGVADGFAYSTEGEEYPLGGRR